MACHLDKSKHVLNLMGNRWSFQFVDKTIIFLIFIDSDYSFCPNLQTLLLNNAADYLNTFILELVVKLNIFLTIMCHN